MKNLTFELKEIDKYNSRLTIQLAITETAILSNRLLHEEELVELIKQRMAEMLHRELYQAITIKLFELEKKLFNGPLNSDDLPNLATFIEGLKCTFLTQKLVDSTVQPS